MTTTARAVKVTPAEPQLEGIADDTWTDVIEVIAATGKIPPSALHEVVCRALSRAYQCGWSEARAEHALVTDTMQKAFNDRLDHTSKTIIAAIMVQQGLSELRLNLDRVASIWQGKLLSMELDNSTQTVTYTLAGRPQG